MAQKQELMTQESLDKRKEELEYLKTVKMPEISAKIKEALSFGDLSENAEYHAAKDEQGQTASKIADLEDLIAHAVIMSDDMYAKDEVSPGCTFKVIDMEFDEEEQYKIVGSQDADPMAGLISDVSPFGKAALGHKVGDVIRVETPSEEYLQFKITEIIK